MKKNLRLCVCGLVVAMMAVGCSKPADETTGDTTAETTSVAEEGSKISDGTITLGEYKGVEVTVQPVEVSDEEVETRIQSIMDSNPDYETIADRPAANGDIVNIDYVGKKDGEAFEGGTAEGYDLTLGSGSFIPGFEEGLVGANTGDQLNLDLTFPEEYGNADLAGAAVVFEVTVNEIKLEKAAELNDAFVEKVSELKTVDEFKADVKKDITTEKEAAAQSQKEYDAVMAVVNNSEITCSQEAVDLQFNQQMDYYNNMVSMYGMALEDYVAMFGMDIEAFQADLRSASEEAIKQKLVVNAVAEKENFKVEDADRENIAQQYGTDIESLITSYGEEAVDETAMMYKVITFIAENAVEK